MKKTDNLTSLTKAQERFIAHLKAEKRSTNTIIAYQNDIEQLISFLGEKSVKGVEEVKATHIEDFKKYLLDQKKYTKKTVSRKLNSIKSFFRFLKDNEVITEDPSLEVAHPKVTQKPPRILASLEYRALRDACRNDSRAYAIVELMLQAGLRISEVANLELDDITENTIIIRPYESHPQRVVPLNHAAQEALKRYIENDRPKTNRTRKIFVTKTGRPLLVRNIRNNLNRYFDLAGIKNAYVNNLRDTFVVNQLEANIPLNVVSQIIGHKRISSTEKYLALVKNREGEKIKLKEL
ncbi:tyrosine-type recombinase/integrase [Candidatus Shapirobacteria bacterium]|nr:tyrosine-type recombinase/integrase [Candidatus Shapirobacteria bacterium]